MPVGVADVLDAELCASGDDSWAATLFDPYSDVPDTQPFGDADTLNGEQLSTERADGESVGGGRAVDCASGDESCEGARSSARVGAPGARMVGSAALTMLGAVAGCCGDDRTLLHGRVAPNSEAVGGGADAGIDVHVGSTGDATRVGAVPP
jgi:hypothetical protein